jgi:hypothetical protein
MYLVSTSFSRRLTIHSFLWIVCLALASAQSPEEGPLIFHPIDDSPEQQINFDTGCKPIVAMNEDLQDFLQASTQRHRATIYLDPQEAASKFGNLIFFTVYLADYSRQSTPSWQKCIVKESTVGSFVGRTGAVDFTATLNGQKDDGRLVLMPLYCVCPRPAIQIEAIETPSKVDLLDNDGVMVRITNASQTLRARVNGVEDANYSNKSYWTSTENAQLGDGKPFDLEPSASVEIPIKIRPRFWNALVASLKPLNAERAATTSLDVKIGSSTYSGSDQPSRVRLPIRFNPPLRALGAALLLGTLLGAALGQRLSKAKKNLKTFLSRFWKDFLVSTVTYLVAVFLFLTKTKFTLLGLEFDPTQLLPTALIGIFASGGKELKNALGIRVSRHAGGTD